MPRAIFASSTHAVGHTPQTSAQAPDWLYPRPDTNYGVGKVTGEAIGSLYADRYGMDVICIRLGVCFVSPGHPIMLGIWLSPADCVRLFDACITCEKPGFRVVWGVSANTRRSLSLIEVFSARRGRRSGLGKGTRLLTCHRQAVYVLAWFCQPTDVANLGRGFGLSRATSYRHRDEGVEVLAAQAPDLLEALERAEADGMPHLILDGKIVETDRVRVKTLSKKGKEIDLWHSGKTHDLGGNVQAVFAPDGLPLWISDVLPGNVHDLAAAREQVLDIIRPFTKKMPVLADPGYEGAGQGVLTPVKHPRRRQRVSTDPPGPAPGAARDHDCLAARVSSSAVPA